jgi:hypothetical protein
MSSFWISLVSLLNKLAPWLMVAFAYLKGKAVEREALDKRNLEKQVEYAEIDANKPDTIDDDTDRMRQGTF